MVPQSLGTVTELAPTRNNPGKPCSQRNAAAGATGFAACIHNADAHERAASHAAPPAAGLNPQQDYLPAVQEELYNTYDNQAIRLHNGLYERNKLGK